MKYYLLEMYTAILIQFVFYLSFYSIYSMGQSCPKARQAENATSLRIPPSFDTKPNTANLTRATASQSNRICSAFSFSSPHLLHVGTPAKTHPASFHEQ